MILFLGSSLNTTRLVLSDISWREHLCHSYSEGLLYISNYSGYFFPTLTIIFQRARAEQAQKAEAEYRKLLAQRAKDAKEKKKERRRSSLSKSKTSVSSN